MAFHQIEKKIKEKAKLILQDPNDNRIFLLTLLASYVPYNEHELGSYKKLMNLIVNYADCFDNYALTGHITGSALVINKEHTKVLMTHHKIVGKWLQFGGHSDGDSNVLSTGLREAIEESGISQFAFHPKVQGIFDFDVHKMVNGDNKLKGQPHDHYDIRSLLIVDTDAMISRSVRESHEVKWISISDIANYNIDSSCMRMMEKVIKLREKL